MLRTLTITATLLATPVFAECADYKANIALFETAYRIVGIAEEEGDMLDEGLHFFQSKQDRGFKSVDDRLSSVRWIYKTLVEGQAKLCGFSEDTTDWSS